MVRRVGLERFVLRSTLLQAPFSEKTIIFFVGLLVVFMSVWESSSTKLNIYMN